MHTDLELVQALLPWYPRDGMGLVSGRHSAKCCGVPQNHKYVHVQMLRYYINHTFSSQGGNLRLAKYGTSISPTGRLRGDGEALHEVDTRLIPGMPRSRRGRRSPINADEQYG